MKRLLVTTALFIAALTAPGLLRAADHLDAPKAKAEPSADITDLYAWMTADASKLNLVVNVMPLAGADATFSDATTYVIHVNSSSGYGAPQTDTPITCKFYDVSKIECWAGNEYAVGDPSATTGLMSDGGKMKVFAGLRDDPFFFEFDGFNETVKAVVAAAPTLTFDANQCPALDAPTSTALVNQLKHGKAGAAAKDFFVGARVLSLVVQIDKTVVNGGGPVLGVWASTHN